MQDINNQVSPLKVKENGALYNLTKFLLQKIDFQRTLNQDQNIEIEGRIGQFGPKDEKDLMTGSQLNFMQMHTSTQGMQVLNDIIPGKYSFDSDVQERKFERTLKYLEQISKVNALRKKGKLKVPRQVCDRQINFFDVLSSGSDIGEIKNTEDDLMFDIFLDDDVRITYYVNKGKFQIITKEQLQDPSRDIIHNQICLRIGSKKETVKPFQNIEQVAQLISSKQVRLFRVKQRKTFSYQFMDISLTRVCQIGKQNNTGFQELSENLMTALEDLEFFNEIVYEYAAKFHLKTDENYISKKREIETEIRDLRSFFQDQPKIVEMKLRAFIRNLHVLFRVGDEVLLEEENMKLKEKFKLQAQVKHMQEEGIEEMEGQDFQFDFSQAQSIYLPEIGEYLIKEIYFFAHNFQVPDQLTLSSSHN